MMEPLSSPGLVNLSMANDSESIDHRLAASKSVCVLIVTIVPLRMICNLKPAVLAKIANIIESTKLNKKYISNLVSFADSP